MSTLYLTLSTETISKAITDLATKAHDLTTGTKAAPVNFECLIGSDNHPDITLQEQVSRLEEVRAELLRTMEDIENERPSGGLSEHAIAVLSSYEEATARPRLDVPHSVFGPGIPCAQLSSTAIMVRAKLALILQAIAEDLDPPQETYLNYFEAYEEEVGTAQFEADDDLWFISTSIQYLTAIIEHPELAWEGSIEIPDILRDEVLGPALERDKGSVRFH